ncbi:MAG: xanthine dehydrogenase family protein molybdopterin-binding subunit [Thermodesulfobacteriota bacterium]
MSFRVGDPVVRVDGLAKVTGQASYAADLSMPGMLYGKVLGSPYPHAKIKAVRLEKARELPGVRAVAAGRDFPYLHGECIIDIPFLAIDKVRYVGEPVVAVAAEDLATAERALGLVEVEYEELPAVFDPEEALKPGAPLIHEELEKYRAMSLAKVIPGTNICHHFLLTQGDIEKGFLQSDYVFEDRFSTPQVQHAAIEPHASIASVDATGRITVWGQNDSPHRARKEIAQALGIPQARVRVITGYVGGNFGGKGGLKPEAIAIALAHKVRGRPVKVVFSREEVFRTITRSGCIIYLKTGVRRDGTLLAMEGRLIWDTGAFAEKGPTISQGGAKLCTGPYVFSSNARVESFTVFTNKPMAGAMRGYGLPQVAFARESQMDMIAQRLGMDPLALRMKNAVDEGSKAVTGQRLYVVGMKECLERLQRELYQSEEGATDGRSRVLPRGSWVRGKGIACVIKGVKTPTVSAAYVKVDEDGSTSILTSTVEVGQGSHTVLTQMVADVLGMEQDRITVSFADTDVTPYDTSTTASRSTFHMGNAVLMAAEDVKRQLLTLAGPLLDVGKDVLQLHDGSIWAPDGRSVSIAQVLKSTFGGGAGAAVLGKGVYTPQDILGMEDVKEKKLEYFSTMSVFHQYAAQGAEVMVDLETGEVRVLRLIGVHDVGRAINPKNCQQQVEGAMSMGLGFGLMEEYLWDRGRMVNSDFLNYAVPTALDCPPMEVFLVEKRHPQGPFGAKGVGEIASAATAPAIANAVYNACGVRIRDLPLKASKILKELQGQKK